MERGAVDDSVRLPPTQQSCHRRFLRNVRVGSGDGQTLVAPSLEDFDDVRAQLPGRTDDHDFHSFTLLEATTGSSAGLDAQVIELRAHVEVLERTFHGDMANLPLKQMEAFIIGRLQGISWGNDVQFVGVQPADGGLSGPFRELLFNVELQGQYFDVFAWLEAVREQLGFVVIKQFEMSPINQSGIDEPELQVSLTMASYRWVEA